jgi:glycosyltransferase involved in cell wall biosynthesis
MDFGLFDRAVLDHLRRMDELNHFLTGVIVWLGFRQTRIFYRRRARRSGTSKWNMGKRVKAALDAIVSFSYVPIRAISYAGLLVSFASLAYGVYVLVARMFDASLIPGWASVMAAVLFLGGLQLTMLGILGEYVWRGTEQAKSRPQYIVMDAIGLDAPPLEYAQPLAFTHPVGTGR